MKLAGTLEKRSKQLDMKFDAWRCKCLKSKADPRETRICMCGNAKILNGNFLG